MIKNTPLNELYDILIVGGGPVGSYCAYLAKEKGLKILLIEATSKTGGQPLHLFGHKMITDYPSYQSILGSELIEHINKQLESSNPNILLNTTLLDFKEDKGTFICKLNNNSEIYTKNIIFAIGNGIFQPNLLKIPIDNKSNIDYIPKNYEFYKNKRIIVLGGGDSAVDWTINIARNVSSCDISIIHRRDEFRANGENVKHLYQFKNINVYLNYSCVEIKKNCLKIIENTTKKIKYVNYDNILVQYGQKINNTDFKFLTQFNTNKFNQFIVNKNQMTNVPNIYAVGNCCFYESRPNMIITGHGEASIAVNDILQKIKNYEEHKIT